MKKYSYKFTPLNIVFFCLGILAAVACIALNVRRLLEISAAETSGTYDYISAILAIVIGAAGMIILIPAIGCSKYIITNDKLITRWGIIASEIKLSDITRVTVYRTSLKLVVSYNAKEYAVINIDKNLFENFCDELKAKNDKIFYCLNTENSGENQ